MKRSIRHFELLFIFGILVLIPAVLAGEELLPVPAGRLRIHVPSSLDGSVQDSYLTLPSSARAKPSKRRPLAVLLHTWSNDLEQRQPEVEVEAEARDWLLLAPNFRGRNDHPEACGSRYAQQDILDAVEWVRKHHAVDERRIYLLGLSGGGFMTMLMAARHPQTWAAASAWVGISNLSAWYDEHRSDEYGTMLRGCFGGGPTDGEKIAAAYRGQSPLTHLRPGLPVALDIAAGKDDDSVSVRHTLWAFCALAPNALSEAEIAAFKTTSRSQQAQSAAKVDPLLGRRILLRRTAGDCRITIFDGGHEWFPKAAIEWLAQHHRS
jgi:dipeptidyl aminopeptidase/acylaminoacyl peptidase